MLIDPGAVPCRWAGFGFAELDPDKYRFTNQRFVTDFFSRSGRAALYRAYRRAGVRRKTDILAALDMKTVKNTGIQSRFIYTDGTVEQLAAKAVRMALAHAGVSVADIDCIVVGRNTGAQFASTASHVKAELGIPRRAMAFDVQEACTGGLVAMQTAIEKIWTSKYRCVVAVGVDRGTELTSNREFEKSNLFGDGAFAIVMLRGLPGQEQLIASDFEDDPHDGKLGWITRDPVHGFQQDGRRVHEAVAVGVSQRIGEFLSATGVDPARIVAQFTHQPSLPTIEFLHRWTQKRVPDLRPRLRPISVVEYGNMSAASVGDLLCRAVHDGSLRDGDLCLATGFGASMNDGHILWTHRNWW